MQMISENPTLILDQVNEAVNRLPFFDIFPDDLRVEWNKEGRVLSLLNIREPRILAQQRFTRNEWLLLTCLIQFYPYYVPHETLLSQLTFLSEDAWRQRLQEIRRLQPDAITQELKPVYRALSGVRAKLKKLYPQLRISLVRNTGYVFMLASEK